MDTTPIPDALLAGLNPPQAQAVSTLEGPVMVVAGPGSGKTRVLTHRVAALLATGTLPWRILAVTFTNKAAAEMRERLEVLVGEDLAAKLWVSTFHSLCVRLLRRFHVEAGLDQSFSVADADDSRKLVTAILKARGRQPDDARAYSSAISWAKNNLQTPAGIESDLPDVALVYADYQQALRAQRLVDFDDLLVRTYLLLRDNDEVRADCQERFAYIMVDEYQDTNRVQYEIVRMLSATHHNLFVVGDHDQSVYAFRGAFPAALGGFSDDFPGTEVVILNQNYRSTKAVLETANALIARNPSVHRADLWTENGVGAPVRLLEFDDDRHEATWVIQQLNGPGARRAAATASGASPAGGAAAGGRVAGESAAIIVRTNAQTRPFEAALTAAGIPYVVVGTQRFYDRAEIKDALAWLRLALNPADLPALRRAAAMPKRGLGDKTLAHLVDLAQAADVDPITAAGAPDLLSGMTTRMQGICASLAADVAAVRAAAHRSPAAALDAVYAIGLKEALADDPDRVENLSQLSSDATVFVPPLEDPLTTPDPTSPDGMPEGLAVTRSFVESAALASSNDQRLAPDTATPPVSLITAHASKGREFDTVYVAGVEETIYPHSRSADDPAAVAEERRLLFVAASRARHQLVLSWCRRRMIFGRWSDSAPSPFLLDLPETVQQLTLAAAARPDAFDRRQSWNGGYGTPAGRGGGRSSPARPSTGRTTSDFPAAPGRQGPGPVAPAVPPVVPLEAAVLLDGVRVTHPVFGAGVVVGDATETRVSINFAGTTKVMMRTFSPLTLVG